MDFRLLHLDLGYPGVWEACHSTEGGNDILNVLPSVFPRLRCILVDGVRSLDISTLSHPVRVEGLAAHSRPPWMLSARNGQISSLSTLLTSKFASDLVYLDISYLPGSLKYELEHAILHPRQLPNLRMLKVQGRELTDDIAIQLVNAFDTHLWSLDVNNNRLTDLFLEHITMNTWPHVARITRLRTDTHFDVEGTYVLQEGGNELYGQYAWIHESPHSETFNHPRRHLMDPPLYTQAADNHTQMVIMSRHNGRERARSDSVEEIKQILLGSSDALPPDAEEVIHDEIFTIQGAITHLHVDGNAFSARAVHKMLRESPGHLKVFECSSARLSFPAERLPPWLPKTTSLVGFLGGTHLFRPVISVNLQVLRIHHSLVTNIPTVQANNIPLKECFWLAETIFEKRASMAYPQVFMPDMNPRLYSLTLTDIPRYSSGILVEKLVSFLKLASMQERAIQDANVGSHHRSPTTLRGLRHLRLEVGGEVQSKSPDVLDFDDIDADKLASLESTDFSFFAESGWTPTPSATSSKSRPSSTPNPNDKSTNRPQPSETSSSDLLLRRLSHFPYCTTQADYLPYTSTYNCLTNTVPVWIGTGIPSSSHPAVNAYMHSLCNPALHDLVGPASPAQIAAGAPTGSYLFHAAWDAMLVPPPEEIRRPTAEELAGMRDVVEALKEYRGKTKAKKEEVRKEAGKGNVPLGEPHYHWCGKLEVSCLNG